jgi:acetyl esterase/lipase
MSATQLPQRVADLRLRASAGPLRTRVWWPASPGPGAAVGVLLLFVDARLADTTAPWLRELASRAQLVIVSAPCAPTPDAVIHACLRDATAAVEWAGEHAAELDAEPGRLFVGGIGLGAALAAAAALEARDRGWPAIAGQLLIQPDLHGHDLPVLDRSPVGVAPATVVTFGRGTGSHDGHRYASRLRQASVDVHEFPYDASDHHDVVARGLDDAHDRLVHDLALTLQGARVAA